MPNIHHDRLNQLRSRMIENDLDGLLVPKADEYQSEYLADYAERLRWLTNFSGSAAFVVVLREKAAFFTDDRYDIQSREEVDEACYEIHMIREKSVKDWLIDNLEEGQKLGFDPWLHTISSLDGLKKALAEKSVDLVPTKGNLIDQIWQDQPDKPKGQVFIHPVEYAGLSVVEKFKDIQQLLNEKNHSSLVLTTCESIAWAFNIRGADIDFTPLVQAYALIPDKGKASLFIEDGKLNEEVKAYLADHVSIFAPPDFSGGLKAQVATLANQSGERMRTLLLAKQTCPQAVLDIIQEAQVGDSQDQDRLFTLGDDPCQKMKTVKNWAEIEGMRRAHEQDALAVITFLSWLDKEWQEHPDQLDELTCARKIDQLRLDQGALGPSFDAISGSGPNGAIMHYRVSEESNRLLDKNSMLLIDSGGQYKSGTTDITRTIALGEPDQEMCENYTLVLKGHIALSKAIFPPKTTGAQVDTLARNPLWQRGLDYRHGTGHGVGAFLGVHESPPTISPISQSHLEPGNILSNEPGFYKEGHYGIRIENLILVIEMDFEESDESDAEPKKNIMYGFETLSFAPYDKRLIVRELLEKDEIAWIDQYHQEIVDKIGPLLNEKGDKETMTWLEEACKPL